MSEVPGPLRSGRLPLLLALAAAAVALALDLALGRSGSSSDFVRFLGRFHPLLVHLPIGFVLLVAFTEGLSLSERFRSRVDPVLGLLWPALVLSALLAFSFGLLLAHDGGYPARLVNLHRRLTLTAVVAIAACYALWTRVEQGGAPRIAYRALLGGSLLVLSVGAHFGGSLSRGDAYLFEFAPGFVKHALGVAPDKPAASSAPAQAATEPLVYRDVVAPLLDKYCADCHGAKKTKGGLRLDSFAALMKGGEHAPELVAGDAAHSKLVQRMRLPPGDDDRMPPEDKPRPSAAELELIVWWIDRGATETLRVRDTLAPDGARGLLIHSLAGGAFDPGALASDRAQPLAPTAEPAPGAPKSNPAERPISPTPRAASGQLYADAIAPLFSDRCGRCHGAQKQKGKLRVDSLAALEQGGKGGPGIVPGTGKGSVLERIRLPSDDDHHMPPSDEPQLTSNQIALLAWWVNAGGNAEVSTSAAPIALVAAARARPVRSAAPTSEEPAKDAPASAAPAPPSSPTAARATPEQLAQLPAELDLYRDLVAPILHARCADCHGGADPDGELRIDDLAKLVSSGAVVPGDVAKSGMIVRMRAPLAKLDHMPPRRAAQPEAGEIDAIALWIAGGAHASQSVASASLTRPIAELAEQLLAKRTPSAPPVTETASRSEPSGVAAPRANMSVAPQHAGCASCSVGARPAPPLFELSLLTLAFAVFSRRARRPRR